MPLVELCWIQSSVIGCPVPPRDSPCASVPLLPQSMRRCSKEPTRCRPAAIAAPSPWATWCVDMSSVESLGPFHTSPISLLILSLCLSSPYLTTLPFQPSPASKPQPQSIPPSPLRGASPIRAQHRRQGSNLQPMTTAAAAAAAVTSGDQRKRVSLSGTVSDPVVPAAAASSSGPPHQTAPSSPLTPAARASSLDGSATGTEGADGRYSSRPDAFQCWLRALLFPLLSVLCEVRGRVVGPCQRIGP